MEAALHSPGRAEHDPGQRGGSGTDIDETDAGLQLDWPGRIRDDRNGLRHRRRLRRNGALHGGLSVHESGGLRLHHPVLDPNRQRQDFRLRRSLSKRPSDHPRPEPLPALTWRNPTDAGLLWKDLPVLCRLGRSPVPACGCWPDHICGFDLLLHLRDQDDGGQRAPRSI